MFLPKNFAPLQAADLLAWCHNLSLVNNGHPPLRYDLALDRIAEKANDWRIIDLEDPDRIPTILGIPLRDPNFRYKCKIIRRHGRRRALIRQWPKEQYIEPKLNRASVILPDQPVLDLDAVYRAVSEYEGRPDKVNGDVGR